MLLKIKDPLEDPQQGQHRYGMTYNLYIKISSMLLIIIDILKKLRYNTF